MLSDTAIKHAKPGLKPDPKDKIRKIPTDAAYKLADEKGLYALIQPTGGKLWRFDYRFDGKRKTLALGYPDVTRMKSATRSGL